MHVCPVKTKISLHFCTVISMHRAPKDPKCLGTDAQADLCLNLVHLKSCRKCCVQICFINPFMPSGLLPPVHFKKKGCLVSFISSPEHEVLMVSYCGQSMSVVCRAASTIALKAYYSYTPGPVDSILGRKHRGDL